MSVGCMSCGASWSDGEHTSGCAECGGGALDCPCPFCDGACGARWKRAVMDSHDFGEAHWVGGCQLATSGRPTDGAPARVVSGNLVEQPVEVIVNAWNRNIIPWWLLIPRGVAGAIRRSAGTAPFRALARTGSLPLGHARLTGAGRLPYRGIIHVAAINMLWRSSREAVADGVRNAMSIVGDHGFASVAFPLLGAGTGGLDPAASESVILETLRAIGSRAEVIVVRFPG